MSPKGYILDSNGQISLKLCVAMGKWLISVKNSKNSLIFANFGCFGMFRVKKTTFPLSEIAQKGQFSGSHPYGLQQKWLQILRRTTRGLVAIKKRNLWPKPHKCPFLTYLYFWEYFCLEVAIFKKVTNFDTLKEIVFRKPPGCTSKLCNSLFWGLKGKKEIKGLFVKFWWEIYLKLWFFVPKFSNKAIFGTDRAQKSIKMAWIPEEWVRICMKLWNFSIK